MPDPNFVTVTKGQAELVASNVTTGQVHKVKPGSPGAQYFHTYVLTGNPAPTTQDEFRVKAFVESDTELISANAPIDVYLWLDSDEDGIVRVDI
jgi:hypothetical protein